MYFFTLFGIHYFFSESPEFELFYFGVYIFISVADIKMLITYLESSLKDASEYVLRYFLR